MVYNTKYYFTDGRHRVWLATFYFDGRRIWYEKVYSGEPINSPHFDPSKLNEQLEHIVKLPILRAYLRAKTLPMFFKDIKKNTLEHFRSIRQNSTFFKFSPIEREGSNGLGESVRSLIVA